MTAVGFKQTQTVSGTSDTRSLVPFILLAALASVTALLLMSQIGRTAVPPSVDGPLAVDQTEFAAQTGVWIEHVALMGGGGFIEIRYRILDSELSEIVHDLERPPRLITNDGIEFAMPRHEHAHYRVNKLAVTYDEQLVNFGGLITRGDVVTVAIGAVELTGVTVQ